MASRIGSSVLHILFFKKEMIAWNQNCLLTQSEKFSWLKPRPSVILSQQRNFRGWGGAVFRHYRLSLYSSLLLTLWLLLLHIRSTMNVHVHVCIYFPGRELHQNSLAVIPGQTLHNMPALLHLWVSHLMWRATLYCCCMHGATLLFLFYDIQRHS